MSAKLPPMPKHFWRDNESDDESAAAIVNFSFIVNEEPELRNKLLGVINETNAPRAAELEENLCLLQNADTPDEIVSYMRKNYEMLLSIELIDKVLPIQEAVMPLVLRRFMTSGLDCFIEASFILFCKCDIKYAQELYERYSEIRSPYARANACLIFAERNMTDSARLLLSEYKRFRDTYTADADLSEFPLLGLHLLYGK